MLQIQRLVLFPFGVPSADDVRERCADFLLSQRGDLRRVIDDPFGDIERFCRYLHRIAALRGNAERPLVVLTRSCPISVSLVQTRMRMECVLPVLRRATWAVLVDRRSDPGFEIAARHLGKLQLDTPAEGSWTGPSNMVFVVVCVGAPTSDHEGLEA